MNKWNWKKVVQWPIFESRWMLVIFCLGLLVAQMFYCIKFCEQVAMLFVHFKTITETDVLVAILNLLDMFMIATLIKMVVTGSYQVFIDRMEHDTTEKVTSGLLKTKMGTALITVSGVNLLQLFLSPDKIAMHIIVAKCGIHVIFVLSALAMAYMEYLHEKGKALEKLGEEKHIHKFL